MKRISALLFAFLFITSQCFGATGWVKTKPASDESPSDISTLVGENNAALDLMLSKYQRGAQITYLTAATLTVAIGETIVSNTAGTIRLMLANTSATTVTWANIDTGAEEASTTYYVYAVGSATTDTTFTIVISKSATTPTGVTYYKRLGTFYNDASSNITLITNDNPEQLASYDSGWFAITKDTAYSKTHSLGTTKVAAFVYTSDSSDGSGLCSLAGDSDAYARTFGTYIAALTTTTITLRTATIYVYAVRNSSGTDSYAASGYARILMFSLE